MPRLVLLFVLTVLICYIDQVQSSVTFSLSLKPNQIDLNCSYAISSNVFTSLSYTKDGETFFRYDAGQEGSPTFTPVPGISLVKMYGGCRMSILNWQDPESAGVYQIKLFYTDKKGILQLNKKKYRISFKADKCKPTWLAATKSSTPDSTWLVAAVDKDLNPIYVCRDTGHVHGGYFVPGQGCLYIWSPVPQPIDPFEILQGSGFTWNRQNGATNPPANVYEVAVENNYGPLYIGRCNVHDSAFIGKVTNGFFFFYNNAQVADCPDHDTLVCAS